MFNKKIIPLATLSLVGALALSGCSVGEGLSNDKTTPGTTKVDTMITGQTAIDDYNAIYKATVAKATTEGYTVTMAGNGDDIGDSLDIYDPAVSTSEGISIMYEVGTRIKAEYIPNYNMFPDLTTTEAEAYDVTEKDGTFTFVDKSNSKTSIVITTSNGLETSILVTIDGEANADIKISLGLSSEQKSLIAKWFDITKDDVIVE